MTNKKEVAQALKDAVKTLYADDWCAEASWEMDKPTVIIVLREVINQLQQSPGIISCPDILDVCDEVKTL